MGAFETYKAARADYDSADQRYQAVRKEHTEAINRLNEAQKNFDAWVAGVKSNAPLGSDWKQRRDQ